jgi:hypothetical protein
MTTNAAGGISQAQAQLFVTLMQEQSLNDAVNALSDSTTNAPTDTSGTNTGTDFASLLSSALGTDANTTTASDTLSSLLSGTNSTTSSDLNALLALAGTAGSTTNSGSASGNQIATIATQLAGDLRGANNQAYDPMQTPTAVQQAWNTPGWGNGNVQCVAFVDGVYQQAGIALPATPNATDFWSTYQNQPGWSEVANGQGLPQPGDIIAFAGGAQGYGHVAVVTAVTPPTNGQPGQVTFAQANSPTSQAKLPMTAQGQVSAWPGYQVQGFIRPT